MKIEGVKYPFLDKIKWKEAKWTPFGFCFAESLRGIKHFQDFKKADFRQ